MRELPHEQRTSGLTEAQATAADLMVASWTHPNQLAGTERLRREIFEGDGETKEHDLCE